MKGNWFGLCGILKRRNHDGFTRTRESRSQCICKVCDMIGCSLINTCERGRGRNVKKEMVCMQLDATDQN